MSDWRFQLTDKDVERFHSQVDSSAGPNACWPWTRELTEKGYGHFYRRKQRIRAHRVAYFLAYGGIADDLNVCHDCDSRACCNPAHLWLGTQQDNVLDMCKKGRQPRLGHRGLYSYLTDDQAAEVRRRRAAGETYRSLATAFGVNMRVIEDIARGLSHKRSIDTASLAA